MLSPGRLHGDDAAGSSPRRPATQPWSRLHSPRRKIECSSRSQVAILGRHETIAREFSKNHRSRPLRQRVPSCGGGWTAAGRVVQSWAFSHCRCRAGESSEVHPKAGVPAPVVPAQGAPPRGQRAVDGPGRNRRAPRRRKPASGSVSTAASSTNPAAAPHVGGSRRRPARGGLLATARSRNPCRRSSRRKKPRAQGARRLIDGGGISRSIASGPADVPGSGIRRWRRDRSAASHRAMTGPRRAQGLDWGAARSGDAAGLPLACWQVATPGGPRWSWKPAGPEVWSHPRGGARSRFTASAEQSGSPRLRGVAVRRLASHAHRATSLVRSHVGSSQPPTAQPVAVRRSARVERHAGDERCLLLRWSACRHTSPARTTAAVAPPRDSRR